MGRSGLVHASTHATGGIIGFLFGNIHDEAVEIERCHSGSPFAGRIELG